MTTNARLNTIRREAQAAREAYHVSRSDAARRRLKTALKRWLLAGGIVRRAGD